MQEKYIVELVFLEINNFLKVVLHHNHSHLLEKMLHFQDDHNHPKKLVQDRSMSVQEKWFPDNQQVKDWLKKCCRIEPLLSSERSKSIKWAQEECITTKNRTQNQPMQSTRMIQPTLNDYPTKNYCQPYLTNEKEKFTNLAVFEN